MAYNSYKETEKKIQEIEKLYNEGNEEEAYKLAMESLESNPSLLFVGTRSSRRVVVGSATLEDVMKKFREGL